MYSNKLQVLEMTEENGLSWSCKADLPAARHAAAAVVHEGKVWVMGGRVNGVATASVLTYDPEADAWGTAPPLPTPCSGCSATTMDGEIFLSSDCSFQYKNAEWSEVSGGIGVELAAVGCVLLG